MEVSEKVKIKRAHSTERILRVIDAVNERLGQTIALFLVPLALITLTEVVCRYIFNAPTIWAWDVNLQIFGIIILLSVGFTLLRERHVRITALLSLLPPKVTKVFELIGMVMVMYVAVILIWQGGIEGWEAFWTKEKLNTLWAPYIFYIKMLYPVGGVLLLLQAVAKFIRDITTFNEAGGVKLVD